MKFSLLAWLFPPKCPVCKGRREQNEALCAACKKEYEREKRLPCRRCGKAASGCLCRPRYDHPSVLCYPSVFRYRENSPGGRMILTLKDRKNPQIVALVGKDMAKALQNGCIFRADALVTYVPRSKSALLEKGVDQAKELAFEVARQCGFKVGNCLVSCGKGRAQKELDAAGRALHASKNYEIGADCPELSGRQVILVDDILTTGATMNACARLLKEAGAESVVCLSAGRR